MKTTVFGPAGIDETVRGDLEIFLNTSEQDLEKFATWLDQTSQPFPIAWSEIDELIEKTAVEPHNANRILVLLRFLLTNWKAHAIELDDIQRDFLNVGYSEVQTRKIVHILSKLKGIRDRVYLTSLKKSYEVFGIPTIDDVNLLWDIRPVFRSPAYSAGAADGDGYDQLLTQTNVLILEIAASTEKGTVTSTSYQFSEEDFERFSFAIDRAKRQLEIMKKRFTEKP